MREEVRFFRLQQTIQKYYAFSAKARFLIYSRRSQNQTELRLLNISFNSS
ncbi:hypothetical protein [Fischerella thermalis]